MFLSRAFLNPASRTVRGDFSDPGGLHRTVMRAFPDDVGPDARKRLAVLHRLDGQPNQGRFVLLVQSALRPEFEKLPAGYFLDLRDAFDPVTGNASENPAVRDVGAERARIVAGSRFAFRLRANTTKKVAKTTATGERTKNGTRVPVRGDDARLQWLSRHAEKSGFRCLDVRLQELPSQPGRAPRHITLDGAVFDGALDVTDADAFRAALDGGIGPAKAFGFGLLSIAPLR